MATESLITPIDQQPKVPLKKSTVIGIAVLVIALFLIGLLLGGGKAKKPGPDQQSRPADGQATSIGNPRTIEMELRTAGEKAGIRTELPPLTPPADTAQTPGAGQTPPAASAGAQGTAAATQTAAGSQAASSSAGAHPATGTQVASSSAGAAGATKGVQPQQPPQTAYGLPPAPLPSDMIPPDARRSSDTMAAGGRRLNGSNNGAMSPEEAYARGATAKSLLFDDTSSPKNDPAITKVSDNSNGGLTVADQPVTQPIPSASSRARDDRFNDPTYKALVEKERQAAEALQQLNAGSRTVSPADSQRTWMREMEAAPAAQGGIKPTQIPTRWVLAQGNVIPAILGRKLNSDLPGEVVATVSTDVYDSIVGTQLLIPKGSKLVGAYSNGVNFGQERLMFAFNRLILPSGLNFNLPAAKGMDQSGAAGIEGDVNNHFFKMFASSFFVAWLADKAEKNAPAATATTTQQSTGGARTAAGQVLVEVSRSILDRNRSIPTTITVDAGQRISVQVVRDMEFPSTYIARVMNR